MRVVRSHWGALVIALLAIPARIVAFDPDDQALWPDGFVTLRLSLGDGVTYEDGTSPNQTALAAIDSWNPYMHRVQLSGVATGSGTPKWDNGVNNVSFGETIYGQSFSQGVLAVTLSRYSNGRRVEADVVVNAARPWEAYRGGLRHNPDLTPRPELRRVLGHEFGHVLGLDHPDDVGQAVIALMNSTMGNVDATVADDQDGIASLYGRGVANPAMAPSFDARFPRDVQAETGDEITLYTEMVAGTVPLSLQWLKDGVPIPGATATTYRIGYARVEDAGRYALRASNEAGVGFSREAMVAVAPPVAPEISWQTPADVVAEVGSRIIFSIRIERGTRPLTFQWFRDGSPIPGASSDTYVIYPVSPADAGTYSVRVTNEVGSTEATATLTVLPTRAPTITRLPLSNTVLEWNDVSFWADAEGPGTLSYFWTRNGMALAEPVSARSDHLWLTGVREADAGDYRLVVTSEYGTVTSDPITLTVLPRPWPATTTGSSIHDGRVGQSVGISGRLSPVTFPVAYQWYHNGSPVAGQTQPDLQLGRLQTRDAGDYHLVATYPNGSHTSAVQRLYVTVDPNSAPGWIEAVREEEIVYFLFSDPARVERYDLVSESFLSPISLHRQPEAMSVRDNVAYFAFNNEAYRLDLATLEGETLFSVPNRISALFHHAGFLYASSPGTTRGTHESLTSFNLSTRAVVATSNDYFELGQGYAVDMAQGIVFAGSKGNSDRPLVSMELNADGTFGAFKNLGGKYVRQIFLSPDGTWIATDGGWFFSATQERVSSTISACDAVAFSSDGSPLVLRGNLLTWHNQTLHEVARRAIANPAESLFVRGSLAFAFSRSGGNASGVAVEKIPVDAEELSPAAPVDASQLAYTPDQVELDRDGCVLLYSRAHQNVFRWSVAEERYVDPLPLLGRPNLVRYAPHSHRLFLLYPDGRIHVLPLDGSRREEPFGPLLRAALDVFETGSHVVTSSGEWGSFYVVNGDGSAATGPHAGEFTQTHAWSEATRRLYYFDEGSTADAVYMQVLSPDGVLSEQQYRDHVPNLAERAPIRVSPAGDEVVMGNGIRVAGDTLELLGTLPVAIDDAAWLGSELFTMRRTLAGGEVQHWSAGDRTHLGTYPCEGWPLRLLAVDESRLLLVSVVDRLVRFTLLDAGKVDSASRKKRAVDARLSNLSTRAEVGAGDRMAIAGFVVAGTGDRRMLVRGVGPGLLAHGIGTAVSDPTLALFRGTEWIEGNDDWLPADTSTLAELGAFPLEEGSSDAAMVLQVEPGSYTVHLAGKQNGTGVGLVELYDDPSSGSSSLVNISTRAWVGTGERIMIPGLVIAGSEPMPVLIRAVGPGLQEHGVAGFLADPRLVVLDHEGQKLAENDNWWTGDMSLLLATMEATGAFPLEADSKDAALVISLPPGQYTAHAQGPNGLTGVVLVEAYTVP